MANYGGDPGSPYNLPPPPQRPSAPASVLTAVKLMYAGAGLSVISFIIGLTQLGTGKSAKLTLKEALYLDAKSVHPRACTRTDLTAQIGYRSTATTQLP